MATCKRCGKSGIFLKVSSSGFFSNCEAIIKNESFQKQDEANELNNRKFATNLSKAQLELLCKFRNGNTTKELTSNEFWKSAWEGVLKQSVKKTIQEFVNQNLLIPAGLPIILDYTYKATELKGFCKEKGLKVSGKKEELINRLIENNEMEMKNKVRGVSVLVCSEIGNQIVQNYLNWKKEEQEKADEKVINALISKEYKTAIMVMIDYERNQVFPRGLGVDWNHMGVNNFEAGLRELSLNNPKSLIDIPKDKLELLKVLAGFSFLWGGRKTNKFNDLERFSEKFDNETCQALLVGYIQSKNSLDNYRNNSDVIAGVQISSGDDSCPECQKLMGKVYKLSEFIPELPHPECTHKMGCRCCYLPVVKGVEHLIEK